MDRQQHGILSLALLLIAIGIGFVAILGYSVVSAVLYLVISILSLLLILYSFCCKCPCRLTSCGHVFPGKLTRFLPQRGEEPYTPADIAGVAVALLIILLDPQYWLIRSLPLFTAFWILILPALIEIRLKVCHGCRNDSCPVHKNEYES
jgi:hypothetical protein